MLWKLLRAAFQPRSSVESLIARALAFRERGYLPEAERILRQAVDRNLSTAWRNIRSASGKYPRSRNASARAMRDSTLERGWKAARRSFHSIAHSIQRQRAHR